jgi:hypothetical protein
VDPKVYTPEMLKANFKGVTSTIAFEPNGEMKNPAITLYVQGWQEDASELIFRRPAGSLVCVRRKASRVEAVFWFGGVSASVLLLSVQRRTWRAQG